MFEIGQKVLVYAPEISNTILPIIGKNDDGSFYCFLDPYGLSRYSITSNDCTKFKIDPKYLGELFIIFPKEKIQSIYNKFRCTLCTK